MQDCFIFAYAYLNGTYNQHILSCVRSLLHTVAHRKNENVRKHLSLVIAPFPINTINFVNLARVILTDFIVANSLNMHIVRLYFVYKFSAVLVNNNPPFVKTYMSSAGLQSNFLDLLLFALARQWKIVFNKTMLFYAAIPLHHNSVKEVNKMKTCLLFLGDPMVFFYF